VEDYARIELQVDGRSVGPGNGSKLCASAVAHIADHLAALLFREEGKVSGLVQQAWIPGRKVGWWISPISTGNPISARKAAMVEKVRSDKLTR
jgi:hypothetical protein